MDTYHIALFIHIVTLVVAASVTAIVKLTATRRIRARTVAEALEWHNLMSSAAKFFPACLVSFTATGFYMLSFTGGTHFSSGYVDAGLFGVILLLASGTYLGIKGAGLKRILDGAAARDPEAAPPRVIPPAAVRLLPVINSGLALGVVFDMVTKPATIALSLGIVVLGGAIGMILAARQGVSQAPAKAAKESTAEHALRTS
jgi:hypothetical protein